uniref:Uncharacterized protein n=1 Tax=Daphnia galeata TaxID=27404 RepID=A0A8J2RUG0_9CRUS|nr:unnamed protein product [Daphnia galeata]
MEDNGSESVSEAKGQAMKKKVNVLEAMAKYNLKKQQEREESMKAPSKPKPIVTPSPKSTPEKHQYQPRQEYVHEIDMDWNIIHVTETDSTQLRLEKRLRIRWNSTRNLLDCDPNWRNKKMQHKEMASQLSLRHAAELSALNEQLMEADNMRATNEKESALLKEKVEQSRQESSVENEEVIVEVRRAHEREKQLLLEDTKRVVAELERFSDSCLRLQSEKRVMEEELSELRSKQAAVAQWEAQISEIIQWVSDEKDARGYLQALTSKMTEEMENLKTQGVGGTPSNSSLQSEIQAKELIREELTQIRADFIAMQKELWEVKQQREEPARELVRKDSQMKEMRQRLESGDGCNFGQTHLANVILSFIPWNSSSKKSSIRGRAASADSEEGDIEDNRPPSVLSSSNKSEFSFLPISVSPVQTVHRTTSVHYIQDNKARRMVAMADHLSVTVVA